jgi:hypothetical protein
LTYKHPFSQHFSKVKTSFTKYHSSSPFVGIERDWWNDKEIHPCFAFDGWKRKYRGRRDIGKDQKKRKKEGKKKEMDTKKGKEKGKEKKIERQRKTKKGIERKAKREAKRKKNKGGEKERKREREKQCWVVLDFYT